VLCSFLLRFCFPAAIHRLGAVSPFWPTGTNAIERVLQLVCNKEPAAGRKGASRGMAVGKPRIFEVRQRNYISIDYGASGAEQAQFLKPGAALRFISFETAGNPIFSCPCPHFAGNRLVKLFCEAFPLKNNVGCLNNLAIFFPFSLNCIHLVYGLKKVPSGRGVKELFFLTRKQIFYEILHYQRKRGITDHSRSGS